MKLLSIAIPCYNSQSYMRKCVESLLPGGDDVEIIIVNDGSKDETASIAEEYAVRYPSIVKRFIRKTEVMAKLLMQDLFSLYIDFFHPNVGSDRKKIISFANI